MVSDPINSGQIDGETLETVTDFIFLGSKTTLGANCSPKIKRCVLLGRKAMTNLDRVLKSRDCLVKAMVFPLVMYGCESWTIEKAECRKIDAFKLWYWRKLLIREIVRDREACCTAVHGVTKSWTRLRD